MMQIGFEMVTVVVGVVAVVVVFVVRVVARVVLADYILGSIL